MHSIRQDVNGLAMVAASLIIISTVLLLVGHQELETQREHIRSSGSGLAQALSRVPSERLISDDKSGFLPLLRSAISETRLAYLSVVSASGVVLDSVTTDGFSPPELAVIQNDPGRWRNERLLEVGAPARLVREFTAPLMVDGQLAAQVRVGYFEPTLTGILIGSSLHARIALVVFLLMPLAQLWLHREIQPLARIARELDADESLAGSLFENGPPGNQDISSLAEKIRSFSRLMDDKTQQMNRERMALLASSKVLAHQKGRADTVVETLPDAVIALEPTGRVAAVNQRAIAVLRKSREELVGSEIAFWSPSESVSQLVARHVGKSGRVLRSESVDYSPDESTQRRHRASIHPAANGSLSVVVIHDISEAEAARKSQAEFLAHMAHELKAPLNVMSLYSESLLEKEAREDSIRIDACNVIADEIDRLNGLINNIFSISRIEGGAVSLERQRVRLSDMLTDLFESASRDGETLSLEFSIELPGDLGPVFVDKQLFSIAIKNILSNAIKYNRQQGSVTLMVSNDETGLSIRIRDTGPGIPEEEIGMIFEKFYRSEHDAVRKVSGHGLGLALVKEIVVLHGGEIQVHSELGKGSEFALLFDRGAPIFREGV